VAVVRVLSFNIAIGGEAVDIAQVVEAIRLSGADVAGLQECEGNAPRIAALLGWAHVDERHQVVSRYPIVEPDHASGRYVYVHVEPERVFALANIHLPSDPYGPYAHRDGATVDETLALERAVRGASLEAWSQGWRRASADGVPLIVTGDFNAPSHRDWGAHATGHRTTSIPWPVSHEMELAGFVDTYRVARPDRPGITWTSGFPHPRMDPDELTDRIDFVWASAGVTVSDCCIVGPEGVPDVELVIDRWPSDHLAVVATLQVPLAPVPPFVGVLRTRVHPGDTIAVRFAAPGGAATDRLVLVASGATVTEPIAVLAPREVEHVGLVRFGTGNLSVGVYDVVLVSSGVELGRTTVHVIDRASLPRVAATRIGRDVHVAWADAPARKYDWIGLYRLGDPDIEYGVIAQAHTGASVTGSHLFTDVPDGPLTVRLLHDDSFAVAAECHLDARP
jgi:endonuclease/exonuclease/phosphatase family metal-dependent hydrolase